MSKVLKNGGVVSDPAGDVLFSYGANRWKYLTPDEALEACNGSWDLVSQVDALVDEIFQERQDSRDDRARTCDKRKIK